MTDQTDRKISRSLFDLWSREEGQRHFDVIVVGSGYGGAVAADDLSRATDAAGRRLKVGVLERGLEYLPGQFPSTLGEMPKHVRVALQQHGRVQGKHEGLFDLRVGKDVSALVANGLGGGSLINGGVMLEPRQSDFDPGSMLHDLVDDLARGGWYERARQCVGAQLPPPDGQAAGGAANTFPGELAKFQALAKLAQPAARAGWRGPAAVAPAQRVPLSVAASKRPNAVGVMLKECAKCGDCFTGCNVGAKDSLDASLLERAQHQGAEIFTGASVLKVTRTPAGGASPWCIEVMHTNPALQAREDGTLKVWASRVVLAAGALGSTEILLRSRSDTLSLSSRLGQGYSSNGDNVAAVYGLGAALASPVPPGSPIPSVDSCAGEFAPLRGRNVGPTITGALLVQPSAAGGSGVRPFLLQEFAIPAAMRRFMDETLTTARAIEGLVDADWTPHGHEPEEQPDPHAVHPDMINASLVIGVIGHDDATGVLRLPEPTRTKPERLSCGTLAIHWPEAKFNPQLDVAQATLRDLACGLAVPAHLPQPVALANPVWRPLPSGIEGLLPAQRGTVITVHPLGGCGMGVDARTGVVNAWGQVFDAGTAGGTHDGLVVLDGAIIPGSLGVNPALTITATALRAMPMLRKTWGYGAGVPDQLDGASRRLWVPEPRDPQPPRPTQIEIIERLNGQVQLQRPGWPGQSWVVELSLAFEPLHTDQLTKGMRRKLAVNTAHDDTRLRLYDPADWDRTRLLPEHERAAAAVLEARIKGELHLLHREPSCGAVRAARAWWAFVRNRGLRDAVRAWRDGAFPGSMAQALEVIRQSIKLASRAGEVRRFDYVLTVASIERDDSAQPMGPWLKGQPIHARKRFTYGRRANPISQVTSVQLTRLGQLWGGGSQATLQLDAGFLASRGQPLVRILDQDNHVQGLADLLGVVMYFARLTLSTHLWTFRQPDPPRPGEPDRLPGPIKGLALPEVTELIVDHIRRADLPEANQRARFSEGDPVKVRLTRYRPPVGVKAKGVPVAMIHGYSVSGNTFTHPSIQPNVAQRFAQSGREVWVIDLRSSTAQPTAQYPWAIEQVALVDIPAALLHIRQVTGGPVDVLAHCIGCTMLSMALLADSALVTKQKRQLAVDMELSDEQLGTLDAFNGLPEAPHPCVRRVIMSQKGPFLRYTDDNIFRAFLLQMVRKRVLLDSFQFRPPDRPGVLNQLIDSLLASVPYPDEDYDVDNPGWPFARASWVATRHRMDALYGRDFNAANLRPGTLEAIDDLFGPMHLDTVAQIIHFARQQVVTSQRGRALFVTQGRLKARWFRLPTMFVHGAQNGLIDQGTQLLNEAEFQAAGVPVHAPSVRSWPYSELGHQDLLIGRHVEAVCKDMLDFLDRAIPKPIVKPVEELVMLRPWLGPRLRYSQGGQEVQILAMASAPGALAARLWLIPVKKIGQGFEVAAGLNVAVSANSPDGNQPWLRATPDLRTVDGFAADGFLAVLVMARSDLGVAEHKPPHGTQITEKDWRRDAVLLRGTQWAGLLQAKGDRTTQFPVGALDGMSATLSGLPPELLTSCWVPRAAVEESHPLHRWAQPQLNLALGSCQYPGTLLDPVHATRSLQAMASRVGTSGSDAAPPIDLVLLAGDVIYADATAGLLDPTRRDELFEQPWEQALQVPAMRALMRQVPVHSMLDDHEIEDNWTPWGDSANQLGLGAPKDRQGRRDEAVQAWQHYMQLGQFGGGAQTPGARHYAFSCGGVPIFMADTRSVRRAPGPTGAGMDRLLGAQQWAALQRWLLAHRSQVKFVLTPSSLMPRSREVQEDPSAAGRADAWEGYPGAVQTLLHFLVMHDIEQTVFLSGDEHHSFVAQATVCGANLRGMLRRTQVVSIHSSALYAPVPFANGAPTDLVAHDAYVLGPIGVRMDTRFAPAGDGFMTVKVLAPTAAGALGGLLVSKIDACEVSGPCANWSTTLQL